MKSIAAKSKNRWAKIIFTSLLLLVAVWLSATFYTGKVIENNQQHYAQLAEESFNNLRDEIAATPLKTFQPIIEQLELTPLADYHRGFFSSTLSYAVKNKAIPDEQIVIDIKIMHGPIPVNALMRFNFMPKMAEAIATIRKNETSEALFKLAGDKQPLSMAYNQYYNNAAETELTIAPLEFSNSGTFSGVKIKADKQNLFIGPLSVNVDDQKLDFAGAKFTLTPQTNTPCRLDAEIDKINLVLISPDITFSIDSVNFSIEDELNRIINNKMITGNFTIQLNKLALNYPLMDLTTLIDSIISEQQIDKNQTINYHILINKLIINDVDFGSITSTSSLNNVDITAFVKLNELSQESIDRLQKHVDPTDRQIINNFTQSEPIFKLNPFSWKNTQGEAQLNMDIKFKLANLNRADFSFFTYLLHSTDEFNFSLDIPQSFSRELVINFMQSGGLDRQTAERNAETQLTFAQAVLSQMYVIQINEQGNMYSKFAYKDGQASLNDQAIPDAIMNDLMGIE